MDLLDFDCDGWESDETPVYCVVCGAPQCEDVDGVPVCGRARCQDVVDGTNESAYRRGRPLHKLRG